MPIAGLLINRNATVTIAHSRTNNLDDELKNYDIVIGALSITKCAMYATEDEYHEEKKNKCLDGYDVFRSCTDSQSDSLWRE